MQVLGFTLTIRKSMVLKSRNSTVLDSETLSTVQPNLRVVTAYGVCLLLCRFFALTGEWVHDTGTGGARRRALP